MTDEQRKIVDAYLREVVSRIGPLGPITGKAIDAYQVEHERMRQFIRNLADESRVYLESDD